MKKNSRGRVYYPDLVRKQFVLAQPNVHWYTDITEFVLKDGKTKYQVLILLEGYTKEVLGFSVGKNTVKTSDVVKLYKRKLITRKIEPKTNINDRLIIHSDRGSVYSSKQLHKFFTEYEMYITPSHSEKADPKGNAVLESFNKTLKYTKNWSKNKDYQNKNLKEIIGELEFNENIGKIIRTIINEFIEYYNNTEHPIVTELSPIVRFEEFEIAQPILPEATFKRAYSEKANVEDFFRRNNIYEYNKQVHEFAEYAFQAAPINIDPQILVALMKQLATVLSFKIENSTGELHDRFDEQSEEIAEVLKGVKFLVDKAKTKSKKHETLELRDALPETLFDFIKKEIPESLTTRTFRSYAQFQLANIFMYHSGVRANEARTITKKHFDQILDTGVVTIVSTKTSSSRQIIFTNEAINDFKQKEDLIHYLFVQQGWAYLGQSAKNINEPMAEKSWIRFINKKIQQIAKKHGIEGNLMSHSYRINYCTRLLSEMPLQKVSQLVGHKSVQTTMSYNRWTYNKEELREEITKAFFKKDK